MPLSRKLAQLVEDLAVIDDAHERLSLVVERSKRTPPLPPAERIDEHRVRACVSVVWLVGEVRDGLCTFRADAESPVVRALVVLLCDFFSGFTPAMIAATEVDPLAALDLTKDLSPTRRNGLAAALGTIRAFARSHLATP
ncbi:MAG: SufE family protein [Verrucomicrobiota bacterium]